MRGNFDNTGRLVLFTLRRERIMSALWIVLLAAFSVLIAPALGNLFDDTSRMAYVETVNNPAMIAMMGPVYGAENYTVGAMFSNTMLLWVIIAAAIMNILLVIRHTRGDEEKGRIEVVRSLPAGRLANLNATMITAVIVNAGLALLTGLPIALMGIESMDFGSSMLYGVTVGVSGLFFAGLAALFAQLFSSSRGAVGLSFLALAVIYMMRAAGDIDSEALSLASPMGLAQRTQVYVEDHWWPVLVLLIETAVLTLIAFALNAIRDMDQGFIHAKPGRTTASVTLRSPLGLAFRLLRNTLFAWIIGIFLLAASYASILGDIENFVNNSEFYAQVIGLNSNFTTAQMFVSMVISMISLFALVPVLTAAMKLRGEEKDGRTEHVLSRAVSRVRYLSGYTVIAFSTSVLVQFATALGLYSVAVAVLPDPGDLTLGYLLKATFAYLPSIWVIIGAAVLLIGLLPRATGAVWGYFGFTFFATFIGRIPDVLPEWFPRLTPFGYTPQLPVDEINYMTLAVLTGIAAALTAAGFFFYSKRDMSAA